MVQAALSQTLGSEVNYEILNNDSIIIRYRIFELCNGKNNTDPTFNSIVYATDNSGVQIQLKPKKSKENYQIKYCEGFTDLCHSDSGLINIKEFVFTEYLLPNDPRFNRLKTYCSWTITLKMDDRDSNITNLKRGYSHFNYCLLNRCELEQNASPSFNFHLLQTTCNTNAKNSIYFNIKSPDSDYQVNWGKAMSDLDSFIPYETGYDYNYPLTPLRIGNKPLDFVQCAFDIGICMWDNSISYYQMNCDEVCDLVFEIDKLNSNNELIGRVRRDFRMQRDSIITFNGSLLLDKFKLTNRGVVGDTMIATMYFRNSPSPDTLVLSISNTTLSNAKYEWLDTYSTLPGLQIIWVPDTSMISKKPYTVSVRAQNSNCPIPVIKNFDFNFYAYLKPTLKALINSENCGRFDYRYTDDLTQAPLSSKTIKIKQLQQTGLTSTNPVYQVIKGNTTLNPLAPDTIQFFSSGLYQISHVFKYSSGEVFELIDTILKVELPEVFVAPSTIPFCHFQSYPIVYSTYSRNQPLNYRWSVSSDSSWHSDSAISIYSDDLELLQTNLTLQITDSTGCATTAHQNFYFEFNQHKLHLGEDFGQCFPDSSITVSGFKKYVWSTGDTAEFLKINSEGKFWCTVTDDDECVQTDTIIVTKFPQSPGPKLEFFNGELYTYQNGWLYWFYKNQLIKSGYNTYISLKDTGQYQCVITDKNGCPSDTSIYVYKKEIVGIDDNLLNNDFSVVIDNDQLRIVGIDEALLAYTIFELNGREIQSGKVTLSDPLISVSNLKNGVYYVYLQSGFASYTLKFILISN